MKRKSFVFVLLLITLLFFAVGCGMTQPSGESASDPNSRTAEMDEEASNDNAINAFKRKTSELSQMVDEVVPSENNMEEKKNQYNGILQQIDALNEQIGAYEDQTESDYKAQKLSERDYKVTKMDIEKAEDALSAVKEKLETKFGVED